MKACSRSCLTPNRPLPSFFMSFFSRLCAAFVPQTGQAAVQPDASDCSCQGSHKEQQPLGGALCPHPRPAALPVQGCVHVGGGALLICGPGDVTAQSAEWGGGLGGAL